MLDNESIKNALDKNGMDSQFIRTLGLDDTLKFGCKRCGTCCSNRDDIILSPYDIYRIAKETKETPTDVITKYCKVSLGSNSCLPIITLKSDERKLCPFLKFDLSNNCFGCSINNSKPGSCILHPIGVVRSMDLKTNDIQEKEFFEVQSCSNNDTMVEVKVRDFIKPFLEREKEFDAGYKLISITTSIINTSKLVKGLIRKDSNYITEEELNNIKIAGPHLLEMVFKTYMVTTIESMHSFDMDKEFLEQLDDMEDKVKINALNILAVFDGLNIDLRARELTEDEEADVVKIKEKFDANCEALMKEFEEYNESQKEVKKDD